MSLDRSPSHLSLSGEAGLGGPSAASGIPAYGTAFAPELSASLADRDRLCPMLAGVGWLHGSVLQLRLPAGDLTINAPARLLGQVWRLCDGTFTFNELVARVEPAEAAEFARFLHYLLEQGALIDAIFATQLAAGFSRQAVPLGQAAPDKLTLGISRRFTARHGGRGEARSRKPGGAIVPEPGEVVDAPLAPFFASRCSMRVFDDRPLEPRSLLALLWSMAGVVSQTHPQAGDAIPHRTLGSGGAMYLVQWILVLQSPVGNHLPGVYDVTFPRAGQVALVPRAGEPRLLLRAFGKPWQLSRASGAVFGVADGAMGALRYRNRALQYMYMEAGAALQNLALSAAPLGMAASVIGGYCEDTAARLLGLNGEIMVGSVIFGPQPRPAQLEAASHVLPIDFVWGDTESEAYDLPFHLARARPKHIDGEEFNCWGKDPDPRLAYIKAHAEAVERQGPREPRGIVVGRAGDVVHAITPPEVARYSEAQHALAGFPYKRFGPAQVHAWSPGIRLHDGAAVSVPAQFIYGPTALRPFLADAPLCLQSNSSGCAAGPTLEFALQAALLEVIERDAFMRHWFAQQPGLLIPDRQLPAGMRRRAAQLRARGCTLSLQLLQGVAAQVVLASATHAGLHFTCVAAAARFDRAEACACALDELETMVCTRLVGMDRPPLLPGDVADPAGHTTLYAQNAYFRKADPVLTPMKLALPQAVEQCADLQDLCDLLHMQGLQPAYVDITPGCNRIDQGSIPLTVVKAVVPGLVPVSFGYGREPRGMVGHVDPASFFPHPFP